MVLDAKIWARLFKPVEEFCANCPAALAELINRCLEYDAHKRPERMSVVQGILDRLADEAAAGRDPADFE